MKSIYVQSLPVVGRLLILTFFLNILLLASPLYMIQLYDRVLSARHIETLILLTIFVGFALAVYGALDAIKGSMSNRLGQWLETVAGPVIIGASIDATLKGKAVGAGPLRDLRELQSFTTGPLKALLDLPFVPIFIFAAFVVHFWVGVLTVVSAVILFFITWANDVTTRQGAMQMVKVSGHAHGLVESSLRNAEAIRAMGMEKVVLDRWAALQANSRKTYIQIGDRSSNIMGVSKFVRQLSQSLVLGLGAFLAIQGLMSPGLMIAGSIILGRALGPIEQSLASWRSLIEARAAFNRLDDLINHRDIRPQHTMLPRATDPLHVRGLHYELPDGRVILQDISFDVRPGEMLAIIGPSGAGKSTLCKLVVGARQPSSGSIKIGPVDIAGIPSERIGDLVGYLPQDIELFDGTVRENIARMSLEPDELLVNQALVDSGAASLVAGFAAGLETQIGPGGAFLSGGQRQRVGLARALYGTPNFVVLDEPNASLDTEGEQELFAAIHRLRAAGTAVIVICHSQELLGLADTVLFLQNGRTVAFGPIADVAHFIASRSMPASEDNGSQLPPHEAS